MRRRASLAGRVTDAAGRPLAGALVELRDGPPEFDALRRVTPARAFSRSGADGHFHFVGLPRGSYRLAASLPEAGARFGTARATARAPARRARTVVPGVAELAVPATAIVGRVTGVGGEPVALADVRLNGSGERALSDAQGRFALSGVEPGDRTITVSARGLSPATQAVVLPGAGTVTTVEVVLAPLEG